MNGQREYWGPEYLWREPTAAIVNSRQSKFPVGDDSWVVATGRALDYVGKRGWTVVTSVGLNTWELALAGASERHLPVIMVMPKPVSDHEQIMQDICRRFHLATDHTGFLFLPQASARTPKADWSGRDDAVVRMTDHLLPISIRPDGTMTALLEPCREKIDSTFAVEYDTTPRPRPKYDNINLNQAVAWNKWLIHFTRSLPGPWPDETDGEYYRAVIGSHGDYCRSADMTLQHILKTGSIHAGNRNIRDGRAVVPFTALTQESASRLFRYRPRFVNPGLEPFGVAVSKDIAIALGIKPVIYGPSDLYGTLAEVDKPYFQHQGSFDSQWIIENEWRHVGDFHLNRIGPESLRIVIPSEADELLLMTANRPHIMTHSDP